MHHPTKSFVNQLFERRDTALVKWLHHTALASRSVHRTQRSLIRVWHHTDCHHPLVEALYPLVSSLSFFSNSCAAPQIPACPISHIFRLQSPLLVLSSTISPIPLQFSLASKLFRSSSTGIGPSLISTSVLWHWVFFLRGLFVDPSAAVIWTVVLN